MLPRGFLPAAATVTVRFKAKVSRKRRESVARRVCQWRSVETAGPTYHDAPEGELGRLYTIRLKGGASLRRALANLARLKEVKSVQPH